jgi:hypothetical protein
VSDPAQPHPRHLDLIRSALEAAESDGYPTEDAEDALELIDAELGRLREIERVFRAGYLPAIPGEGEGLKQYSLVHLRMLIGRSQVDA